MKPLSLAHLVSHRKAAGTCGPKNRGTRSGSGKKKDHWRWFWMWFWWLGRIPRMFLSLGVKSSLLYFYVGLYGYCVKMSTIIMTDVKQLIIESSQKKTHPLAVKSNFQDTSSLWLPANYPLLLVQTRFSILNFVSRFLQSCMIKYSLVPQELGNKARPNPEWKARIQGYYHWDEVERQNDMTG